MKAYKIPFDIFKYRARDPYEDVEFIGNAQEIIKSILDDYQIDAKISSIAVGPTVTTFNIILDRGESPKRVVRLDDEFGLKLGVGRIRCYVDYERGVVCLEVPNKKRIPVAIGEVLQTFEKVEKKPGELRIALGKDTYNRSITCDLSKMIHTLVVGASGSGKSVFLQSVLTSLLYQNSPQELRLLLIDPKKVEFTTYNGLPHLLTGDTITDIREGIAALNWAIGEMNRRYYLMEKLSREETYVVNVDQYNQHIRQEDEKLPKIVIMIDEIADLMLANKREVEDRLQTLAQKARAAGIYLIVSTQRPSSDVMNGVLKASFPTRVAFKVANEEDSRFILDFTGAQMLLCRGDYLYSRPGFSSVERMQAPYVTAESTLKLVEYLKKNYTTPRNEDVMQFIKTGRIKEEESQDIDPVYMEALKIMVQAGIGSVSLLQRKCAIGYNKAGRIIEWMEKKGYLSKFDGSKSRKVLITMEEYEAMLGEKIVVSDAVEALKIVVECGFVSIASLQRRLGMRMENISKLVAWMETNGYISSVDENNERKVFMTIEEFKQKFES